MSWHHHWPHKTPTLLWLLFILAVCAPKAAHGSWGQSGCLFDCLGFCLLPCLALRFQLDRIINIFLSLVLRTKKPNSVTSQPSWGSLMSSHSVNHAQAMQSVENWCFPSYSNSSSCSSIPLLKLTKTSGYIPDSSSKPILWGSQSELEASSDKRQRSGNRNQTGGDADLSSAHQGQGLNHQILVQLWELCLACWFRCCTASVCWKPSREICSNIPKAKKALVLTLTGLCWRGNILILPYFTCSELKTS